MPPKATSPDGLSGHVTSSAALRRTHRVVCSQRSGRLQSDSACVHPSFKPLVEWSRACCGWRRPAGGVRWWGIPWRPWSKHGWCLAAARTSQLPASSLQQSQSPSPFFIPLCPACRISNQVRNAPTSKLAIVCQDAPCTSSSEISTPERFRRQHPPLQPVSFGLRTARGVLSTPDGIECNPPIVWFWASWRLIRL